MKDLKRMIGTAHTAADIAIFKQAVKNKLLDFRHWLVQPSMVSNGQFLVSLIAGLILVIFT